MGPRTLVVKKGEHGVLMFSDEGSFAAPAYPLEDVFDPTGAGDTFAGAIVGALLSEQEPPRPDTPEGLKRFRRAMAFVEPEMTARVWDSVGQLGMGMMEDGLVTIGIGVPLVELEAFRAGLPDSFERRLRRHPLYQQQLGDDHGHDI
jgi:hypothetical protein